MRAPLTQKGIAVKSAITFALGILTGNWLLIPSLTERTHADGFLFGIFSAIIFLGFYGLTRTFRPEDYD